MKNSKDGKNYSRNLACYNVISKYLRNGNSICISLLILSQLASDANVQVYLYSKSLSVVNCLCVVGEVTPGSVMYSFETVFLNLLSGKHIHPNHATFLSVNLMMLLLQFHVIDIAFWKMLKSCTCG